MGNHTGTRARARGGVGKGRGAGGRTRASAEKPKAPIGKTPDEMIAQRHPDDAANAARHLASTHADIEREQREIADNQRRLEQDRGKADAARAKLADAEGRARSAGADLKRDPGVRSARSGVTRATNRVKASEERLAYNQRYLESLQRHVERQSEQAKGQFHGPEALRPPFTAEEFARSRLSELGAGKPLVPGGEPVVESYKATINGQTYQIKLPDSRSLARTADYESRMEALAPAVGRALGVGRHMVDTYSFEYRGYQFTASKWADAKPMSLERPDVRGVGKVLSHDDLARLALFEYLVNDGDRHGGNFLFNKSGGAFYVIDMARGFNGSPLREVSMIVPAWASKVRGEMKSEGVRPTERAVNDRMSFSRDLLRSVIAQQPAVMALADRYGADKGAHEGLEKRFNVLRSLASDPHPSMQGFQDRAQVDFLTDQWRHHDWLNDKGAA